MKKCQFCAEEIQDAALVCKHCGRDLVNPAQTKTPTPPIAGAPTCKLCGGEMKKGKESKSTIGGLFGIIIGIFLLFLFPIGTVLGVILILACGNSMSKRRGLWICKNCGAQVERKIQWNEFG